MNARERAAETAQRKINDILDAAFSIDVEVCPDFRQIIRDAIDEAYDAETGGGLGGLGD